jgi:transcriptional regulator with XRE-family HTH domain
VPQELRHHFAGAIRALRLERGWSQEDLAERAGLHRTYISAIERAERNVSIDNIEKLGRAVGISPIDMLGEKLRKPLR